MCRLEITMMSKCVGCFAFHQAGMKRVRLRRGPSKNGYCDKCTGDQWIATVFALARCDV